MNPADVAVPLRRRPAPGTVRPTALAAESGRAARRCAGWRSATRSQQPATADRSPRSHQGRTSGKSIKEKRAAKRAAADGTHVSVVPSTKKTG